MREVDLQQRVRQVHEFSQKLIQRYCLNGEIQELMKQK